MEQIEAALEAIAVAIDLAGVAILVFAALKFVVHFLGFEIKRLRGIECIRGILDLRLQLGSYILLALEFIIISDVIRTGISKSMDDLLGLGLLVVIRIALSFFLGRELNEVRAAE